MAKSKKRRTQRPHPVRRPAADIPTDDGTPLAVVINIELDGGAWRLTPEGLTAALARELRQESGWRVPTLMDAVDDGTIGPDELAGLLFLARRQAGEPVTYDEVEAGLTAADRAVITFDVATS